MGVRGRLTCGENPPDDIACVVNVERLTNCSRWIEVGERSRRVPLHCVEYGACIERPADSRPVGVNRLRKAGIASEVGQRLHASLGLPTGCPRGEEAASEAE